MCNTVKHTGLAAQLARSSVTYKVRKKYILVHVFKHAVGNVSEMSWHLTDIWQLFTNSFRFWRLCNSNRQVVTGTRVPAYFTVHLISLSHYIVTGLVKLMYSSLYRVSQLSCSWARQLPRGVPAVEGCLCHKGAVFGDTIKGTMCTNGMNYYAFSF
jgi:hypothetical protein